MYGGRKTCFVSRDLMREHKALLTDDMQKLFKRWQLSHQYTISETTKIIKSPNQFEVTPHEDENGWHVPYTPGYNDLPKDSYDAAANWICLRKDANKI